MSEQAAYEAALRNVEAARVDGGLEPFESLEPRHIGRFSDGIARRPTTLPERHFGRYSEGLEDLPETASGRHVGRYSEGVESDPGTPVETHLGSFAGRPAA